MGTVRGAYPAPFSFGPQTSGTHQAGDALPGDLNTFRAQLGMNARGSVAPFAALVDFPDALLEQRIPLLLVGDRPSSPTVVPAHRDLQHATHHVQAVLRTVLGDEAVPQRVVSLAKKAAAFFRISRSWRRISFSLRSRRISCCSGVRFCFPWPGKAALTLFLFGR